MGVGTEESKRSLFYKKAPQKIFAPCGFNTARSGAEKFFGYFFSKK